MCGAYRYSMSPPPTPATGLYARIKLRPPPDCVLRRLSEQHRIIQFTPGRADGHQTQIVIEGVDKEDRSLAVSGIDECIWLGEWAVCLLRHADSHAGTANGSEPTGDVDSFEGMHHEMLLYGFDRLPIQPVSIQFIDGWVELHLIATAYPKLRATVSELRAAAFDVDLRQVVQSDRAPTSAIDEQPTLSVVDLSALTARQREVAAAAVDSGYFSSEGATPTEIASSLDISQSTLSEHLRIVIRKLLSQVLS